MLDMTLLGWLGCKTSTQTNKTTPHHTFPKIWTVLLPLHASKNLPWWCVLKHLIIVDIVCWGLSVNTLYRVNMVFLFSVLNFHTIIIIRRGVSVFTDSSKMVHTILIWQFYSVMSYWTIAITVYSSGCFNLYRSLSTVAGLLILRIFQQPIVWNSFSYFPPPTPTQKIRHSGFLTNCLLRRQIARNAKPIFWEKWFFWVGV